MLAVVAALAYTGGPWPYGYRGLGEVFVFVFFGLVAVVGTAYLQTGRLEALYWAAAIPAGALITAILVVNNLRDIPTDTAAGKRTLAVMLGERGAQAEYAVLLGRGLPGAGAAWRSAGAVVARARRRCCRCPLAIPLLRTVRGFGDRRELNLVLKGTARLALVFALLFAAGLAAP